eukprot:Amastigsp_a508827_6.p4 type:complete len:105 gc:universal Amastigsp_a508827_6:81-395(+)
MTVIWSMCASLSLQFMSRRFCTRHAPAAMIAESGVMPVPFAIFGLDARLRLRSERLPLRAAQNATRALSLIPVFARESASSADEPMASASSAQSLPMSAPARSR